jgi:LytTr DNA-binding domain
MWQIFFQPQYKALRLWVSIGFGIYYFLFFSFFQPFKDAYFLNDPVYWTYHYAVFGFIVFFSLSTCIVVLPKFFPKAFLPENLTFNKFCLLVASGLALTLILNYFNLDYFIHLDGRQLNFSHFLFKLALPTIFFTTIPLIIFTLLLFNHLTEKENVEQSTKSQLESSLMEGTPQYETALQPHIYHFKDTSNKKNFNIPSDRLYYITSALNYIEIYYKKEDSIARLVMRNSLKALEEELDLDMNSGLIRCHKAFIVNREKIVEMRGSTKNGQFILAEVEEPIPISRNKFPDLEPQFSPFSTN